ncbi:MAG: Crp/Fnr family transcriptional regulator [Microscillaceae bacterium]|jgi:CRP/FNR family transcriptional regulator|nr:Crp/Fnr family transcriptional regulator [Microscillaceae bacterium]
MNLDNELIINLLQKNFSHIEAQARQLIAQSATLKKVEAGAVLMRTGQYFKSAMLVVKGRIKVFKEDDEGNEVFMYYLEPGSACALSMICAAKREASTITAKTIEETELITLPLALMDELMINYKSWYYFVLENYRQRFEELLETLESVTFKSMDERLEFYLKKQQKALKTNELKITHEEVARDLNSSRVVISRLLKKMEEAGKVKINRSSLLLKNI